ncbi:MAG: hypothetical protein ACR2OU_11705 [Thermomicrobiales bacterium]
MGLFSKYQAVAPATDDLDQEPAEPEPPIDKSLGPLWPPSAKVQILLVAISFFLINLMLIIVFAIVLWQRG